MSKSSSVFARTELETVVNWPLLVSAASVAILLLVVPLVLACIAALKSSPDQDKDSIAYPAADRRLQPGKAAPSDMPTHNRVQPGVEHETPEKSAPRQIYVKAVQPPIPPDLTPIPKAIKTRPTSPPALNPILQVPEAKASIVKRLDESSESYLLHLLAKTATEVDLESVKGTREKLLADARKDKDGEKPPIVALRAERSDLKGLSLREGAECQAPRDAIKTMQAISRTLRVTLDRGTSRASASALPSTQRAEQLQYVLRSFDKWFQDDGLSTLAQMLQVEDIGSRTEFVKRLAQVKGVKASSLLARQAIFDFSWPVRAEAIEALKERPRAEYRQVLMEGLRYPWAPVAAHAAEALAALNVREAIFPLADMLDAPDPCAPVRDKNNKWVVSEIVRINHLRNCLLCHAVSTVRTDPLRSVVPTPGQPLPRTYYSSQKGDFVRADFTYLRQDFSLLERVDKPDKWPEWQRFDYLVRTRELNAEELASLKKQPVKKPDRASYPQHDAVRFALRELTGRDAGESSAEWYETLYALDVYGPR